MSGPAFTGNPESRYTRKIPADLREYGESESGNRRETCGNAVYLGRNADLLITECGLKSGQDAMEWPHPTPEDAIRIAQEAGAKRLTHMHFDANLYRTREERRQIIKPSVLDLPGWLWQRMDIKTVRSGISRGI